MSQKLTRKNFVYPKSNFSNYCRTLSGKVHQIFQSLTIPCSSTYKLMQLNIIETSQVKLSKEAISVGVGINKEVVFFSKQFGGKFHCETRKEAETKDSISETVSSQGLKQEEECDCGVGEGTILAKTQSRMRKSTNEPMRIIYHWQRSSISFLGYILTAASKPK